MKPDSKTRFSNRVENYTKFRPHYPQEMLDYLIEQNVLSKNSVIADIGSGTGISSELFLKNGNTVYGVEPNKEMREAAEKLLEGYDNFISVNGSAENTTLKSISTDLIIAGQAFHWFDIGKAKAEFKRIIRPGGCAALIWNIKNSKSSPLMQDYEKFLLDYGTDYKEIRHENVGDKEFKKFFDSGYTKKLFDNEQVLDYDGLKGRILSASYIPAEGEPGFRPMIEELKKLFHNHNQNGKVKIIYFAEIVWGKL
jgi:ubiquinone/menaquinone biosynthesis C-methylase UbiE